MLKIESAEKLSEIAEERRSKMPSLHENPKHFMIQKEMCGVEIYKVIPTEDVIENANDISPELQQYSSKTSKEFLDTVIEPFYKSVVDFLEKHKEYVVRKINTQSHIEPGMTYVVKEMKSKLLSDIGMI